MVHDLIVQVAFLSGINAFVSPRRFKLQMFNILLMDRSSEYKVRNLYYLLVYIMSVTERFNSPFKQD